MELETFIIPGLALPFPYPLKTHLQANLLSVLKIYITSRATYLHM